jgi:hypothetical protein
MMEEVHHYSAMPCDYLQTFLHVAYALICARFLKPL